MSHARTVPLTVHLQTSSVWQNADSVPAKHWPVSPVPPPPCLCGRESPGPPASGLTRRLSLYDWLLSPGKCLAVRPHHSNSPPCECGFTSICPPQFLLSVPVGKCPEVASLDHSGSTFKLWKNRHPVFLGGHVRGHVCPPSVMTSAERTPGSATDWTVTL